MISQNDLERERYLARVKLERDQLSRLHSAREEGREEGRQEAWHEGWQEGWLEGWLEGWQEGFAEGWLIGTIQVYQKTLKRPLTPEEELLALPLAELQRLARKLESDLPS